MPAVESPKEPESPQEAEGKTAQFSCDEIIERSRTLLMDSLNGKERDRLNVIVCVDDRDGMMFNERRQSRDSAVAADIISLCGDHKLFMNDFSAKMFSKYGFSDAVVSEDFLKKAASGDCCFVENCSLKPVSEKLEQVVIYRWNRSYPADLYFERELIKGWKLKEIIEFEGSSHEKITREIYTR